MGTIAECWGVSSVTKWTFVTSHSIRHGITRKIAGHEIRYPISNDPVIDPPASFRVFLEHGTNQYSLDHTRHTFRGYFGVSQKPNSRQLLLLQSSSLYPNICATTHM
jgi:hypothetical protein